MNGNSHKPVDGKLIAGFNDIAREVFYQAYEIGSNIQSTGYQKLTRRPERKKRKEMQQSEKMLKQPGKPPLRSKVIITEKNI